MVSRHVGKTMSIYVSWVPIALCFSFLCVYGAWKAKRKSSLGDLPGPPPESFLLGTNYSKLLAFDAAEKHSAGNLRQMMREQVGCYDVKLQNSYGMVARINAPFGVRRFLLLLNDAIPRRADFKVKQDDRLWVSDPKAIQYILQSSRSKIEKPYAARFALNTATGPGVSGKEGNLN